MRIDKLSEVKLARLVRSKGRYSVGEYSFLLHTIKCIDPTIIRCVHSHMRNNDDARWMFAACSYTIQFELVVRLELPANAATSDQATLLTWFRQHAYMVILNNNVFRRSDTDTSEASDYATFMQPCRPLSMAYHGRLLVTRDG